MMIIGIIMLVILFVGLFVWIARQSGVGLAFSVYGIVIALYLWIHIAVYFIGEGVRR